MSTVGSMNHSHADHHLAAHRAALAASDPVAAHHATAAYHTDLITSTSTPAGHGLVRAPTNPHFAARGHGVRGVRRYAPAGVGIGAASAYGTPLLFGFIQDCEQIETEVDRIEQDVRRAASPEQRDAIAVRLREAERACANRKRELREYCRARRYGLGATAGAVAVAVFVSVVMAATLTPFFVVPGLIFGTVAGGIILGQVALHRRDQGEIQRLGELEKRIAGEVDRVRQRPAKGEPSLPDGTPWSPNALVHNSHPSAIVAAMAAPAGGMVSWRSAPMRSTGGPTTQL